MKSLLTASYVAQCASAGNHMSPERTKTPGGSLDILLEQFFGGSLVFLCFLFF